MTCTRCSAENPSESRFCIKCGSPLEEPVLAEAESPAVSAYPVQATPSEYSPAAASDPSAPVTEEVRYAGFLIRLIAAFLDRVLVTVVHWIVVIPIHLLTGVPIVDTSASSPGPALEFQAIAVGLASLVIGVLLNWLYQAILTSSERQATFGKQAFGICITDLNGQRISFARATGRYFGSWLSWFTFAIGYLIQPITEKKQALHDIIAGTLVVKKPSR